MDFLAFLANSIPISDSINFNEFLYRRREKSGHVSFPRICFLLGQRNSRYWLVDLLSFLGNSSPISVPFNLNAFYRQQPSQVRIIGFFCVFLGIKNHSSQAVYFLVLLGRFEHIFGTVDFVSSVGQKNRTYWPVDFLAFFGHIDPISEPFLINAFLGGSGHFSGYVYFLLILGHMNQSSKTVYFQIFLWRSHHIYGTVDFLAFLGHHDLVSAPMDFFSFLSRSGHMSGRACFNAILGGRNYIFKKKESQKRTYGSYIIFLIRTYNFLAYSGNRNKRWHTVFYSILH